MHAISLVTGSCLGHSYASGVIADAQRLVSFFRASHQPYSKLKEATKHHELTGTLATYNTTCFMSVYFCLKSMKENKLPFNQVLSLHTAMLASTHGCAHQPLWRCLSCAQCT